MTYMVQPRRLAAATRGCLICLYPRKTLPRATVAGRLVARSKRQRTCAQYVVASIGFPAIARHKNGQG